MSEEKDMTTNTEEQAQNAEQDAEKVAAEVETEKTEAKEATAEAENATQQWQEAQPENTAKVEKAEPTVEQQLAELQNKYVYLQADYQNFRKRIANDIASVRNSTLESTLEPFLTVFDHLSMAETAAANGKNIESIMKGLQMIIDEFRKAFDDLGVTCIDAVNCDFDPNLHDAVGHQNSDTVAEGKIISQWTKGFKMGERLLRPAKVIVSAGPAEAEKNDEAKADDNAEKENK